MDLAAERHNGDFVRDAITKGWVSACHDIADGGLLIAIAEMALAGDIGVAIEPAPSTDPAFWFGEDQARYVVTAEGEGAAALKDEAERRGITVSTLGVTGGKDLTLVAEAIISLDDLRSAHERWMPDYMESGSA